MDSTINPSFSKYHKSDQDTLIFQYTPTKILNYVNDAYCRYFKKSREILIGHNFIPLMPEEDRTQFFKLLDSLTKENPIGLFEHTVILVNGQLRRLKWQIRKIFSNDNSCIGYQCVGTDVTPQ
jgi:PAS domain S-box-containing protein